MDRAGPSEVQRRVGPFARTMADADADLGEMALALSRALQPDLDVIGALAALDRLASECPAANREGVIQFLFGSGRFVGDTERYHRWQNSCLDLVMGEGRGMPITLSVVAIEVARRLDVELVGIGLPGHFVVGDRADPEWFADPFHARSGLDREECRRLVATAGVDQWSDSFLEPVAPRLIIARMLNNLRMSCEYSRDRVRLAVVMQARQAMAEFASAERTDAEQALAVFN